MTPTFGYLRECPYEKIARDAGLSTAQSFRSFRRVTLRLFSEAALRGLLGAATMSGGVKSVQGTPFPPHSLVGPLGYRLFRGVRTRRSLIEQSSTLQSLSIVSASIRSNRPPGFVSFWDGLARPSTMRNYPVYTLPISTCSRPVDHASF